MNIPYVSRLSAEDHRRGGLAVWEGWGTSAPRRRRPVGASRCQIGGAGRGGAWHFVAKLGACGGLRSLSGAWPRCGWRKGRGQEQAVSWRQEVTAGNGLQTPSSWAVKRRPPKGHGRRRVNHERRGVQISPGGVLEMTPPLRLLHKPLKIQIVLAR